MALRRNGKENLTKLGWTHDGLWWLSPHTGLRYTISEAISVEELRSWAASDSAILGDKDHSMWVLAEERDNALIDFEELSKRSQHRKLMRDRATASNLKGKGTD